MLLPIVSSVWDVLVVSSVLVIGAFVCLAAGKRFCLSGRRSLLLYTWHTLFCFLYCWYTLRNGGDAIAYYYWAESFDWDFYLGTKGVVFLAALFVQGGGFSFLGVFLVFNIFGAIGLLAFDGALKAVLYDKKKQIKWLASIIVFLPSVSFWSSALGKDSLSFCSMGLALWAALNMRQRWGLLVVSISIMLLVRPHMAGMMGLGLAGSFVLQRGLPLVQRVLLGGLALVAAAALVPVGLNYAGVGEDADASEVMEYIEERQGHNLSGGGAVDIAEMSLPVQLFTYSFRPTIFEARNFFSFFAALDNTILVFLFVVGGWAIIKKTLPSYLRTHNRLFLWVYSLLAWIVLAMTTANMGIALRQKWMFLPMIIFLILSQVGFKKETSVQKKAED